MIAEWWAELGLMMQILWGVTVVASLLFIIQNFSIFLRDGICRTPLLHGVVNFFLGFGWTAVLMSQRIQTPAYLFILASVVGAVFTALVVGMNYFLEDNANK